MSLTLLSKSMADSMQVALICLDGNCYYVDARVFDALGFDVSNTNAEYLLKFATISRQQFEDLPDFPVNL